MKQPLATSDCASLRSNPESLSCPACGSTMLPQSEWLFHCSTCGYMSSTLSPGGAALGAGFETLRRSNFEILLNRLTKLKELKGARLLEIGCGRGWFLQAAQHRAMIVHGIEPGDDVAISRGAGFDVDHGFFPADLRSQGPFDVIVFNDVFEHIPDPVPVLKSVEKLLSPDGFVVINLPCSDGIFYKTATILKKMGINGPFDRMWQKGLASPHMSYFNFENLEKMAERHTALKPADRFSLPVLSREGLLGRIRITMPGAGGLAVFAAVWVASYFQSMFPPDIAVIIFRKPDVDVE